MGRIPKLMFCFLLVVFTIVLVQGKKGVVHRRKPQVLRALPKLRQFLHYRGSRDASEEQARGYNAQQMNGDESGEEEQQQINNGAQQGAADFFSSSSLLSSTSSVVGALEGAETEAAETQQEVNDEPQNPSLGGFGGQLKFDLGQNQQQDQQQNQQQNKPQAPNKQETVLPRQNGGSSSAEFEAGAGGGPAWAGGNLQDAPIKQEVVIPEPGGGSSAEAVAPVAGINNEPAGGANQEGVIPDLAGGDSSVEDGGPAQQGGAAGEADSEEAVGAGGALAGAVEASSEEATAPAGTDAAPTAAATPSAPAASPSNAAPVLDYSSNADAIFSSSFSSATGTPNPLEEEVGVVALQEGDEAAVAPEPLTDAQKRNIGVGVAVGASAALAMAAGAVYYTKRQAASGAAAASSA